MYRCYGGVTMPDKSIYDLELNEIHYVNSNMYICRVPSGWIYTQKYRASNNIGDVRMTSTFVPFKNKSSYEKDLKLKAIRTTTTKKKKKHSN